MNMHCIIWLNKVIVWSMLKVMNADWVLINPFPPTAAKSGHFVISLCLMPGDFTCQRRASGWEMVN